MSDKSGKKRHATKHRENHSEKHSDPSFFKRYWLELLSASLLILGVFLMVERLEIKSVIARTITQGFALVERAVSFLFSSMFHIEGSDIVGIVLILAAGWLLGFRARSRAIRRHLGLDHDELCPACKNDLRRIPRTLRHRFTQFIFRVRIRRYACRKCGFLAAVWTSNREP